MTGTYSHCDSDSVHASTRASSLTPNKFHKICPGRTSVGAFGQPQCGDGTSFSFYFTRPPQKVMNNEKILIEFMGGGACWDADTCGTMGDYLTFPTGLDDLVGLSCSEIEAGASENNDGSQFPISMLCAKTLQSVDFTAYNTIVVPYCTQDVHVGSNTVQYGDGSTVRHVGAHNMVSVLRWVYRNFPNPFHIALTGCSAGGTALPIAYDLLNKHYNSMFRSPPGFRSVQISVVDDSPVYLTPTYFLENGLDNWNPSPIMKRIRFNYQKYRHSEDYSTKVWEHVLKRGSNKDSWGFVSFTDDPTSEAYFEAMSGTYSEGNGDDGADNNNANGGDNSGSWWSELSASLSTVQSNHANVDSFFTNGEGHCSFGLYYPLQQDGFEEWAGNIFKESPILLGRTTTSVPLFVTSLILGLGLFGGTLYGKLKRKGSIDLDNDVLLNDEVKVSSSKCPRIRSCCGHVTMYLSAATAYLSRFEPYPITASYGLAVTFYFITMLCVGGFTHPVNNPSLGPSAVTLSSFGINNPSLVVYKSQIWRLTTSTFLCSGVLTYLAVMICLYKHLRHVETAMQNAVHFILVCLLISFGSNLLYALFANGASCSSVALVLGLNAFSTTMHISKKRVEYPRPLVGNIFLFVLTCLCFPFNSWIMLLCAVAIGCAIALLVFKLDNDHEEDSADVVTSNAEELSTDKPLKLRLMLLKVTVVVYLLLLLILVFRIRKPSADYMSPYITGCDLVYTTQVNDIVSTYSYDNGNRRRRDEEEEEDGGSGDNADDGQSMCAQFCVPHIVSRPFVWGASRYTTYGVTRGTCADDGYGDHVADKTFSAVSYSVDVELYYETEYGE